MEERWGSAGKLMSHRVYIETTVLSYLTARPSRDLIVAAHQQLTLEWWEQRREKFDLYISQLVVQECGAGDALMARKRLEALETMPLLDLRPEVVGLARALVERGPMPDKASVDALHIAVAAVHGMDYLLTWNCKHIANAEMQTAVAAICRAAGFEPPVICTPEELLGS
jgi:predicted nucleic acid-binding protein